MTVSVIVTVRHGGHSARDENMNILEELACAALLVKTVLEALLVTGGSADTEIRLLRDELAEVVAVQ